MSAVHAAAAAPAEQLLFIPGFRLVMCAPCIRHSLGAHVCNYDILACRQIICVIV